MAYSKAQRARIDSGQCRDCGNARGDMGTAVFCRPCADKNSKRAALNKEKRRAKFKVSNGCNQCGSPMNSDEYSLCDSCRDKARKSYKKNSDIRRNLHPTIGLCVSCHNKTIGLSRYCKNHWIEGFSIKYKISKEKLLNKLEEQDFKCFFTGIDLIPGKNASLDHLIPRSIQPSLINDVSNVVWCDKRINSMKGDLQYSDFIDVCSLIVEKSKNLRC